LSPDLVGRDFTAAEPGIKPASDITYLLTPAGWWCPATVIDLATREVAGYAMAEHHRTELVVDALKTAAGRGGLKEGCIAHSASAAAREYTSREYRPRMTPIRQRVLRSGVTARRAERGDEVQCVLVAGGMRPGKAGRRGSVGFGWIRLPGHRASCGY